MNKIGILGFALIILLGFAYFLSKKNSDIKAGGSVTADRGFKVKEMDQVNKIVIKHVKLQPMVFTRKGDGWIVNGKYVVDPAVFIHIIKVLTDIKLLYVPPENSSETILNSIKNNGIQVDVYEGDDKPSKIIHIGSDTPKNDGTFMMMGGSNQPYAMHLPGLAGGIRSRFEQPIENIRDKFLFQHRITDIKYIKVEYPKSNKHSFKITQNIGSLKIEPLNIRYGKKSVINSNLLKAYIAEFESLGAEKLINSYPLKDSILSTIPGCIIELADTGGRIIKHKYYAYEDFENGSGPSRSPGEMRFQNRLFVLVDNRDFYVVQNRVFGNIFRGFDDFISLSKN